MLKKSNLLKKLVYFILSNPLNSSNQWTFVKYIQLVNLLRFAKYSIFRRLRNFLLYLPEGRAYTQNVVGDPVAFSYRTELYDDLRIECRSNFSEYELISRQFFYTSSKSARIILDIGAYSAIYSITAGLANVDAHVYAFEPNPEIFALAKHNVESNNLSMSISLMQIALSNQIGKEKLYFNVSGWESATASLNKRGDKYIEVEVSTIDLVFRNIQVDLIKIDVEGFEGKVFSGGLNTILNSHPIILSEVLSEKDMASQSEVLLSLGYETPIQVSLDPKSSDFRNYIWFTQDKREVVLRDLRETQYTLFK